MVKLGVNIDHVATIRQARRGDEPDLIRAARVAERSGADGITVHLREDRRHIQDRDVVRLKKVVSGNLNLEMACTHAMVSFACRVRPDDVCLVPEKRQELTTEGGLDIEAGKADIKKSIARLRKAGICVSVFIDPHVRQIRAAFETGADAVELHTGAYAGAGTRLKRMSEYRKLVEASEKVLDLGLILNAGHGLDFSNVVPVAKIKGMNELNIGFSIVSRALLIGLGNAVREMKSLLKR